MTPHQQQTEALFEEWAEKNNRREFVTSGDYAKSFAAFCLERTGKEITILIGNAREEACKVREYTAIDWLFKTYLDYEYSEEAVNQAVEEFRQFRK